MNEAERVARYLHMKTIFYLVLCSRVSSQSLLCVNGTIRLNASSARARFASSSPPPAARGERRCRSSRLHSWLMLLKAFECSVLLYLQPVRYFVKMLSRSQRSLYLRNYILELYSNITAIVRISWLQCVIISWYSYNFAQTAISEIKLKMQCM